MRDRCDGSAGVSLGTYRLLGRSGLRVSPLALGTMTFGTDWGWGADQRTAREIFDAYVGRGGNFIDTANQYTNGTAERLVGEFALGMRDELVIATKYTLPIRAKDPNSGGNQRKSMVRSVESSLKRLKSDYIDLLYLHAWDSTTPIEEILRAMDDLVRSGKVLYLGISNTVAWRVARMQATADLRGWSPLVALQIEYNLVERTGERELIPMASEMGLGVVPWAPLAGGVLADKYSDADLSDDPSAIQLDNARKAYALATGELCGRSLKIVGAVRSIAAEIGRSPAEVSIAWLLSRKHVVSPIVGARTFRQFKENLGALQTELTDVHRALLDEMSAITLGYPHDQLELLMKSEEMGVSTRVLR